MKLTVFQMPHSPYCIPITQALVALGVTFEVVNIDPALRTEVIAASGGTYYQVPMLRHGKRIVIESTGDSLDIGRFLDATFANGRLFPPALEAANLCLTQTIENVLEGIGFRISDPAFMDSISDLRQRTLLVRHKERRFGVGCVEVWRKDHPRIVKTFDTMLAPFEVTLGHAPFLLGSDPVYADFALYGVIRNATWQGVSRIKRNRRGILQWLDRLENFRYTKAS